MDSSISTRPTVALTGASGFVGMRLVPALEQAGWRVRMLLRRDPVIDTWRNVHPQIVAGDLGNPVALRQLVEGVDAVVHVAGLIKAARRRHYYHVNHEGSVALADAVAEAAPAARFLHVSTIAAREPRLSDYAGSKRAGEDAVLARLGERVTVVRPPAVYGPGDRETLVFFQMASKAMVPLVGPRAARAAMIHVDDLVALLVAQLRETPRGAILTASDDRPDGYTWRDVFHAAACAVGNPGARLFHAPVALLRSIAMLGNVGKAFGNASMLTSQKLRELRHVDWAVPAAERAAPTGWVPRYRLAEGFAHTVAWYRRAGWL